MVTALREVSSCPFSLPTFILPSSQLCVSASLFVTGVVFLVLVELTELANLAEN